MRLCFLHGLDSSPYGTKSSLLRKHYPECVIPALPPDLNERLHILETSIKSPLLIVGSSLGGLTALMFADLYPERVKALVLMAPAVGCSDPGLFSREKEEICKSVYVPAGIRSIIIAGKKDELIPLDAIEAMIRRSPEPANIELHAVDDDHNLHQSLDLMLQSIEKLNKS